jgi:ABC-type multidrug transport system ATPase subunit
LESGSILFWDEPENSINPDLMPVLADILLTLSRNGVQIFLATHDEVFARYMDVCSVKDDSIQFTAMYKDNGQIKTDSDKRFDLLSPNIILAEHVKLYERELTKGLNGNG